MSDYSEMKHTFISMTSAVGMGPLPKFVLDMEGDKALCRTFRQAALPMALIEQPKTQIPFSSICSLFDKAARETGDRLFGLKVGKAMKPNTYGLWVDYSSNAPTLGQALQRLIRTIAIHQTGVEMRLVPTGKNVFWSYRQVGGLASVQHTDHVFPSMISFLRIYLGKNWSPSWTTVNYSKDQNAGQLIDAVQTEIRFGGQSIGIAFPRHLLTSPRRADPVPKLENAHLTSIDVVAQAACNNARSPEQNIEAIIALRLLDGQTDIEGAASVAGKSKRTLQRTLNNSGRSYREVLENVRCRKARELIVDSDASLTDIAFSLGYSDPANFTRAFRRWSGRTPKTLRKNMYSLSV